LAVHLLLGDRAFLVYGGNPLSVELPQRCAGSFGEGGLFGIAVEVLVAHATPSVVVENFYFSALFDVWKCVVSLTAVWVSV